MNEYPQSRIESTAAVNSAGSGHFIPVAAAAAATAAGSGGDMPPGAQYFNLPSFAGFSWPFVDHSQEELKHHTVGFVKPSPRPSPYNVKVEKTEKNTQSAPNNIVDRKPGLQKDKLPVTATQVGLQVVDPHPYKKVRKQYRKARTLFSPLQLEKLENEFQKTKYLSTWDREKLARYLQITDTQVKTWFQNRRKKWKRTNVHIGAQLEGCRVGKLYGARTTHTSGAGATLADHHRHIKHNLSSFNVVTPHFTSGGGGTGNPGGTLQSSEQGGHVMGNQPDHMLFLSG